MGFGKIDFIIYSTREGRGTRIVVSITQPKCSWWVNNTMMTATQYYVGIHQCFISRKSDYLILCKMSLSKPAPRRAVSKDISTKIPHLVPVGPEVRKNSAVEKKNAWTSTSGPWKGSSCSTLSGLWDGLIWPPCLYYPDYGNDIWSKICDLYPTFR